MRTLLHLLWQMLLPLPAALLRMVLRMPTLPISGVVSASPWHVG
jgi:hypothetical protein